MGDMKKRAGLVLQRSTLQKAQGPRRGKTQEEGRGGRRGLGLLEALTKERFRTSKQEREGVGPQSKGEGRNVLKIAAFWSLLFKSNRMVERLEPSLQESRSS